MGIPCVLQLGATPCAWLLLLMVVATKYEPGAKEFHQTLLPHEPGGPGAPRACLRCDDSVRRGPGPCSRVVILDSNLMLDLPGWYNLQLNKTMAIQMADDHRFEGTELDGRLSTKT